VPGTRFIDFADIAVLLNGYRNIKIECGKITVKSEIEMNTRKEVEYGIQH